jgi:hypothetical protein
MLMPKTPAEPKPSKRLTLHPLTLEDALRAALRTPLPGKQARAETKAQK